MVLAWGRGEDGQLGHGDADDRSEPEAVHALLGKGITSVHCGAEYTLAVAARQKQTYSWGWYVRLLKCCSCPHACIQVLLDIPEDTPYGLQGRLWQTWTRQLQ